MLFRLHTVFALAAMASEAAQPAPEFNRDIRPILSDRCFACHGFDSKSREADLRLDSAEGAYEVRDGGQAITPGKPEESLAWQRIISADPDEVMPPSDSHLTLSPDEKDLLRRWIESGAAYQPHWTLQRVERPEIPLAQEHPIDALVEKRLDEEQLTFAPEATRPTLLRRLSFDLRGLPPTPEESQAFLNDTSPDAYQKLVDRFLADPSYGERMAWPWLDAARYADSNGFQGDADRTMWPWRDWVIDAFNRNLPYKQFTIWQLAGDLLPNATPEQILATGFLRNHSINGEGGSIPEENRINYAMDMSETTGTVWMGLTMNCCRCHDHKYDALTQRDYYSLMAFFNQTPVTGGGGDPQTPPVLATPDAQQQAKETELVRRLAESDQKLEQRKATLAEIQPAWEETQAPSVAEEIWETLTIGTMSGAEYRILDDGSVLTSGANPAKATYLIQSPLKAGQITSLRLDALRHPTMTKGGIARSDSGNFVLTGIEARLSAPNSEPALIEFSRAEATFEQGGTLLAKHALDEDPATGWAVFDGKPIDRDHTALFHLSAPLEVPAGSTLEITLHHQSRYARHNLGRFRLSVTAADSPPLPAADEALARALQIPTEQRSKAQRALLAKLHLEQDSMGQTLSKEHKAIEKQLEAHRKTIPRVMVMADRKKPRPTHVLAVGSYDKPLEQVPAATPPILPPLPTRESPSNRLDLARWLVSRDHPLTARVTVNRLWQDFFGIGLIKTPEDFGVQSEVPHHPELLDLLAADFMDSGWDTKQLIRSIVTSRTYRQSSRVTPAQLERDPANRLLARGPRFRLPSWMIRDQALAASGRLARQVGGPPVKPYQPEGLWSEATFGKVKYVHGKGDDLYRRSIYTFWRRISVPPMFFDNSKREACSVNPALTNTPLHALATLNDPTFVEAARLLSSRALSSSKEQPELALQRAFEVILSRRPSVQEESIIKESYELAHQKFSADPESASDFLAIGESPVDPALDAIDLAALSSVTLSILNIDEALTKE